MTEPDKIEQPPRPPRKLLKRLLRGTAILVSSWLIASFIVAWFAVQRRHPIFEEPVPIIAWGKIDSLRLTTTDGEELGAWFITGPELIRERPDKSACKQPVVLLMHGHNGRRGDCLPQAEIYASAGCPVLLISLRAHGDSTGNLNDVGYSARLDALAAVDWLEKNHGDRPIMLHGNSMGAATAAFASAQLGGRVRGYILESPYKDLRTAVRNRTMHFLPVVLDHLAYLGLLAVSPVVLPHMDKISPLEAVSGMPETIPVLVLSGSADVLAKAAEAQEICDRIPAQARMVVIEGGRHGHLRDADPEGYRAALLDFIGKCRQH